MLRSGIAAGALAAIGVVGWYAFDTGCDGKIVRNGWQCVRNAGFQPAFCTALFRSQEDAIDRAPATFPSEMICRSRFPNCEQDRKSQWVAKPTPFCVVRGPDGVTPQALPMG